MFWCDTSFTIYIYICIQGDQCFGVILLLLCIYIYVYRVINVLV